LGDGKAVTNGKGKPFSAIFLLIAQTPYQLPIRRSNRLSFTRKDRDYLEDSGPFGFVDLPHQP
jgi:hypothetical protein